MLAPPGSSNRGGLLAPPAQGRDQVRKKKLDSTISITLVSLRKGFMTLHERKDPLEEF